MEKRLVSVIIPTYSRADNIIRAIESVLRQTYSPIEIIVVDDNGEGSDNQIATEECLKGYIDDKRINYIKHPVNKNGSAARNTGVLASKGDFITFLDDDDELMPQKIEQQIIVLNNAEGNIGGVYCGYKKVAGDKILLKKHVEHSGNFQKEIFLQRWGFGTGSNPLFRRAVFEKVGLFDTSFRRKQDIEFMVRFFRHYEIACIPDILVVKHVDSSLNRPSAVLYQGILKHFLDTFKVDIEQYPIDIQKDIYYVSYMQVAILAANESQYRLVKAMVLKAASYRHVRLHDLLRIIKFLFINRRIR